jgi:hypothetical protein
MVPEHNRNDGVNDGANDDANEVAIDRVLAALRTAAPPEGMDARILQRLHQQAAARTEPNQLPASSALASAWWRGALSGAAAATVAVSAILLAQHAIRTPSARSQTSPSSTAAIGSPQAIAGTVSHSAPCGRPTTLRTASHTPAPQIEAGLVAGNLLAGTHADSVAPSRPAPAMPLTVQERELVRLSRIADPRQLAEEEAKVDEESAAEFARLSAHAPMASSSQPQPDGSPDAASKAGQGTDDPDGDAGPNQPTSATGPQPNPASNEQNSSITKEE